MGRSCRNGSTVLHRKFGRPFFRWKGNTNLYLNERGSDKTGLFEFVQALVKTVLNLRLTQRTERILNFLKELCLWRGWLDHDNFIFYTIYEFQ